MNNKYIVNSITQNEQIITAAKFSPIGLVIPAIIELLLLFPFYALISGTLEESGGSVSGVRFLIFAILLYLIIAYKGIRYYFFSELALTNKKIIGKTGIISTKEMNSPIDQILNIEVSKKLWGRIFGYGTLKISTASGTYNFNYIKNAELLKNNILQQTQAVHENRINEQVQKMAEAITQANSTKENNE